MNTTAVWHSGPLLSDIVADGLLEVELSGKLICILLREEQVFAFAARCPHAGGRLCEGRIDGKGNIVCPVHHYKFHPKTGRNTSGEGYQLKTFPTKLEAGRIFVQF
ncbi:MAG: Rieske (2Fe-2S) protein [Bacteroidetes bacterium]|nr:Rieske (2Fe-2S) protein [Bacteroidota bacterium]